MTDSRTEKDLTDDAVENGPPKETGSPAPAAVQPPAPEASGWHKVLFLLRPRFTRAQLIVALLCAALGLAIVTQVRQTQQDNYASLSEDELVRVLDQVNSRSRELESERSQLESQRAELASGADQQQKALEAARNRAEVQGILAGTLPAEGPGIELTIYDPLGTLKASTQLHILEELRNSGAEVIELSGQRLTTNSWIGAGDKGLVVDGVAVAQPYTWRVIGDASTMTAALNMPGGALATVRSQGGDANVTDSSSLIIEATKKPTSPQYASPAPAPEPTK